MPSNSEERVTLAREDASSSRERVIRQLCVIKVRLNCQDLKVAGITSLVTEVRKPERLRRRNHLLLQLFSSQVRFAIGDQSIRSFAKSIENGLSIVLLDLNVLVSGKTVPASNSAGAKNGLCI